MAADVGLAELSAADQERAESKIDKASILAEWPFPDRPEHHRGSKLARRVNQPEFEVDVLRRA